MRRISRKDVIFDFRYSNRCIVQQSRWSFLTHSSLRRVGDFFAAPSTWAVGFGSGRSFLCREERWRSTNRIASLQLLDGSRGGVISSDGTGCHDDAGQKMFLKLRYCSCFAAWDNARRAVSRPMSPGHPHSADATAPQRSCWRKGNMHATEDKKLVLVSGGVACRFSTCYLAGLPIMPFTPFAEENLYIYTVFAKQFTCACCYLHTPGHSSLSFASFCKAFSLPVGFRGLTAPSPPTALKPW